MNRERIRQWLKIVLQDLAGELEDDLQCAISLNSGFKIDSEAAVREIAKELDDAIRDRIRATRLAEILEKPLPPPTPEALPPKYQDMATRIEKLVVRFERGGITEESSTDVARELDFELQELRKVAEHRRGERNQALRHRLRAFLAYITNRLRRARS